MTTLTGVIASPTGHRREGVQLDFVADDGTTVTALTDAMQSPIGALERLMGR
jgi:hypothetical protein